MKFVPLHCHSSYSFHAGVCSVPDLVRRAGSLGVRALALTDTDRMSGLIVFYRECLRQGIKPILGTELTEPGSPLENVVLLARNAGGYGDICEILTRRHLGKEDFSIKKIFISHWPNLILLTHSPRYLKILHGTPNREALFGELINHSAESRAASRRLEKAALQLGVSLAASNNSFFLDRKDWYTHLVLRAIGLNATLTRLKPEEVAHRNAFFRSPAGMAEAFPRHGEALANTVKIADMCNVRLELDRWIMPKITVPRGHTPESFLAELSWAGLERNYGGKKSYARARGIQAMELRVVSKLKYASYFLMVRQIREWSARFREGSRYRHPSDCSLMRGSAANSITFYNIGASSLDPIRYNLYFERFLNEDRAAPPDADLDFGWDERDAAFEFFNRTWGQDRVAVICTTNHFHRRSAFRETAKVFGWTEEQITEFMEKPGQAGDDTLKSGELGRIRRCAALVRGKPRFLGQHPGGVVVTNQPVWRHVACQRSGGEKDRIITQVDMHSGTDDLGLIKFDILGNGSISVLRDTLRQLEEQGIPDPKVWEEIKVQNDPAVLDMIAKGQTRGVFYIESPAQMRLNMKADARSFEEIGITTSLIRPAGAGYCHTFVARHRKQKLGITDWAFLHDSLQNILNETHDCLVFQEDVIKVCHLVAGMPLKRADRVRKMMNSLHEGVPEDYGEVEKAFLEGCVKKSGFTPAQARALWSRICSFVGFSFCKSHSLSFAQLSFKCAYLKHYHPAQFMAAVISNNRGFYHRSVYLNEARRFGVAIRPLHVNHSETAYVGRGGAITPGLMHVRGLGRDTRKRIITVREQGGPYAGVEDFVRRTGAGKAETRGLIRVGALDGFGLNRPQLLFTLDGLNVKRGFDGPVLPLGGPGQAPCGLAVDDYNLTVKCLDELHYLGYILSGDILSILDLHPAFRDAVPCREMGRYAGRRVKLFGWPVTGRLHTVPGRGQMKFLTLEDASGYGDAVFWPETFRRCADALTQPGPYEIWGRVQEDWGTFSVIAERVRSVHWNPVEVDFELASQRLSRTRANPWERRAWKTAAA